jgi:hypothetical protein
VAKASEAVVIGMVIAPKILLRQQREYRLQTSLLPFSSSPFDDPKTLKRSSGGTEEPAVFSLRRRHCLPAIHFSTKPKPTYVPGCCGYATRIGRARCHRPLLLSIVPMKRWTLQDFENVGSKKLVMSTSSPILMRSETVFQEGLLARRRLFKLEKWSTFSQDYPKS